MAALVSDYCGSYTSPDMLGCPFCGKEMKIEYNGFFHAFCFRHANYKDACHSGEVRIEAETYDEAIEKWNRRADYV